jgi:putative phosphoribosyl transferase
MASHSGSRFIDRRDAGQRLAAELKAHSFVNPIVLALPRGGVPVGYEVAHALDAPLDVLLVRKLGAPGYEEFGIGAVVDGASPQLVLNAEAVQQLRVSPAYIERERDRQLAEIERRRRLYCGDAAPLDVRDHTAIIVDDGIATGGTMLVALRALLKARPRQTVVAVPVAPAETLAKLSEAADDVVCLATPSPFGAVGMYYEDFTQTSDEEVRSLLLQQRMALHASARAPGNAPIHPHP